MYVNRESMENDSKLFFFISFNIITIYAKTLDLNSFVLYLQSLLLWELTSLD